MVAPLGNTVGSLTQLQHAVLVGSLLGDGTLRRQGCREALLEVNHSYSQKEYVDWKYEVFKNIIRTPPKCRKGNGQRVAYRFTTMSLPKLTRYHERFYHSSKKIIPVDLKIGPIELAVWFMDDGSRSRSSYYLNTQQFSLSDQKRLIALLKQTYNIEGRLNRDKQYYRIRVVTADVKKMNQIIVPFLLPYFRYKLAL